MVRRQSAGRRAAAIAGAVAVLLVGVVTAPAPARAETTQHRQWHLSALKIDKVHKLSTGKGVVVAVVDSGVRATHPDLKGQVLDGSDMPAEYDRSHGKEDGRGHGTGVAGLIAARGGGPSHALGIAPGAKILPVQVALDSPLGGGGGVREAIRWATDHGAKVINLSLSVKGDDEELVEAVRYAQSKDVVLVAAGGNAAKAPTIEPPANLPGVIAVSATQRNGTFWSGSTRGPQLALSAPGTEIYTTHIEGHGFDPWGYQLIPGGTSASAPIVAGAAALIRSKFPDMKAPDVINRLIATADDAGPKGRDDQYGFGKLNILAALTKDVPPVAANPLGEITPPPQVVEQDTGSTDDDLVPILLGGAGFMVLVLLVAGIAVAIVVRRGRRRPAPSPTGAGNPYGPPPSGTPTFGAPPYGTPPGSSGYGTPPGGSGYGAQPPGGMPAPQPGTPGYGTPPPGAPAYGVPPAAAPPHGQQPYPHAAPRQWAPPQGGTPGGYGSPQTGTPPADAVRQQPPQQPYGS